VATLSNYHRDHREQSGHNPRQPFALSLFADDAACAGSCHSPMQFLIFGHALSPIQINSH
jgi:hypothetical protein